MKKINIIGASTLAALEGNLVMTLLPNVLRRAVRWGSSAIGVTCLLITTASGAECTLGWETFASGTGVNGPVRALATFGTDLIVGGQFSAANQVVVNGIARWNGASWSAPLGTGMNGSVLALTIFNGELIAGGAFTKADNKSANRMASWNGSAWSKLGTAMSSPSVVFALATFNGALYAGGQFPTAGGVAGISGIASWNGSAWSALGTGMNNTVTSLTAFDDGSGTALYAGGYFTAANGAPPKLGGPHRALERRVVGGRGRDGGRHIWNRLGLRARHLRH